MCLIGLCVRMHLRLQEMICNTYLKSLQDWDDKEISSIATKALCRHLWYLSETLISLSFMDEEIDLNTKRMMQALNKPGISSPEPKYMMEEDEDIGNKTLADFVTSSRMMFFEKLRLDHSFLEVDPMNWATRNDYQTVKK